MNYIELNKKNTEKLIKKTDKKRVGVLINKRYKTQLGMIKPYMNKSSSILDIGVRDGAFLNYLRTFGYKDIYGVDIYEKSIEIMKKMNIDCQIADAQSLALNRKFDLIVMSHVLEHCPDPKIVLDNVYNHLNKKGILFIEVPIEKGPPKPTVKSAHYFNFNTYDMLLEMIQEKWEVVTERNTPNRIKVVLRRKD